MKKIQIKKDNLIFSRFEFKYIVKKGISKAIQNEVSNFMEQDTFAGIQNKYLVRSLYFDNNIFTNFHEKIDGLKKIDTNLGLELIPIKKMKKLQFFW